MRGSAGGEDCSSRSALGDLPLVTEEVIGWRIIESRWLTRTSLTIGALMTGFLGRVVYRTQDTPEPPNADLVLAWEGAFVIAYYVYDFSQFFFCVCGWLLRVVSLPSLPGSGKSRNTASVLGFYERQVKPRRSGTPPSPAPRRTTSVTGVVGSRGTSTAAAATRRSTRRPRMPGTTDSRRRRWDHGRVDSAPRRRIALPLSHIPPVARRARIRRNRILSRKQQQPWSRFRHPATLVPRRPLRHRVLSTTTAGKSRAAPFPPISTLGRTLLVVQCSNVDRASLRARERIERAGVVRVGGT